MITKHKDLIVGGALNAQEIIHAAWARQFSLTATLNILQAKGYHSIPEEHILETWVKLDDLMEGV